MENKVTISTELSPESLAAIEQVIRKVFTSMQSEQLQERLLSPSEACRLFSPTISVKTLRRWATDGKIAEHRVGGRIFYKSFEVLESAKTLKRYKQG